MSLLHEMLLAVIGNSKWMHPASVPKACGEKE
jgi:hypothetical protein